MRQSPRIGRGNEEVRSKSVRLVYFISNLLGGLEEYGLPPVQQDMGCLVKEGEP